MFPVRDDEYLPTESVIAEFDALDYQLLPVFHLEYDCQVMVEMVVFKITFAES